MGVLQVWKKPGISMNFRSEKHQATKSLAPENKAREPPACPASTADKLGVEWLESSGLHCMHGRVASSIGDRIACCYTPGISMLSKPHPRHTSHSQRYPDSQKTGQPAGRRDLETTA